MVAGHPVDNWLYLAAMATCTGCDKIRDSRMKPIASLEVLFLQLITNGCLISQTTCTSFPRSETNDGKEELPLNLVNAGMVTNKFKDSEESGESLWLAFG
jgi:hypothetical protein